MTSLFERLDEEEAVVLGELSVLREKVAVAEERLARLTITRETVRSLWGDQDITGASAGEPRPPEESPADGDHPDAGAAVPGSDGTSVRDEPDPARAPLDWEVARERMLVLLAGAGRAMKVQDISAAIGEDTSNARRVETTRSRLKKLATEGRVAEGPTAWFTIVATDDGSRKEGAGMG